MTTHPQVEAGEGLATDERESKPKALLELAAVLLIIVATAAPIAGYLAWNVGARSMGLTMLSPVALELISLGGLSMLLAVGLVMGVVFMWILKARLVRQDRPWSTPLALALGSLIGLSLLAVITNMLGGFAMVLSREARVVLLILGGVGPVFVLWMVSMSTGAGFRLAMGPHARNSWPGLIAVTAVISIVLSGMVAGSAVVPETPASAGGLKPSVAVIHLDWNGTIGLEGLRHDGGTSNDDALMVWLFRADGDFLTVRGACGHVKEAAAFSIPAEAVKGIQWMTEASRTKHCQQRPA